MNHPERRRSIIPDRTSVSVLREGEKGGAVVLIGGGSLAGGVGRVPRKAAAEETDWSKIVAENSNQKPLRQRKAKPEPLHESEGRIDLKTDVIEDYNGKGDLGIILQFAGIGFTKKPVQISKHSRPDSPVFYIPVGYNKGMAHLFLTTRGDILDSQIVPSQMDVSPFFQKELYLPPLATTHDPTSMTVKQRNRLIIVGYNPRTC